MVQNLLDALQLTAGSPTVWLIVVASAIYGVLIGAIPGLTATTGVAMFIPLTFWLEPVPALAAIVTMVACAIFAGDIPTALLRIPGTPASAAYAEETYGLSRRGLGRHVLCLTLTASVIGGLLGAVVLMALGAQLARVAAMFSVVEYFWLYLMGLSCAVIVARDSMPRAVASLLIGLLLSTVGLSAAHSTARFTLGFAELYPGIGFIPAMIGLFGLSEVLRAVGGRESLTSNPAAPRPADQPDTLAAGMRYAVGVIRRRWLYMTRASGIGSLIGILPGAGADIAAWVAMAVGRRKSADPALAEREDEHAIANAATANSSALAGNWVPALVFGIPGDSITAIVIGVLLMKNITPGPEVFVKQATLVYGIYITFIMANLVLLVVGLAAIQGGRWIVRLPRSVLMPAIVLFCVTGAYATQGSLFDVGIMLAMGLLGFGLERGRMPVGPVVLGIILGGPLEERFVQAVTASQGELTTFFNRPIAAALGVACVVIWGWIVVKTFRK